MTANQFYKGSPFRAGTPKNTNPPLHLTLERVDEERKHLYVRTRGGTPMLLAYDGKAGCFHLHKFSIVGGRIGGKVYNSWMLEGEDQDAQNAAANRWD